MNLKTETKYIIREIRDVYKGKDDMYEKILETELSTTRQYDDFNSQEEAIQHIENNKEKYAHKKLVILPVVEVNYDFDNQ